MIIRNVIKKVLVVGLFAASSSGVTLAAPGNIIVEAEKAGDFSELLGALEWAGLVDELKGEGSFTVFAPTNAAFKKFKEENPGFLENLMKPETKDGKDKIKNILLYHVVPAKVTAQEVMGMTSNKSVNGDEFMVNVSGDKVKINDANVVKTDIMASNGIIHVIDKVLVPPAAK